MNLQHPLTAPIESELVVDQERIPLLGNRHHEQDQLMRSYAGYSTMSYGVQVLGAIEMV